MVFYYSHKGAGLAVTVDQPDEVHAKNNLHARCAEEGWPVDGWSLGPAPTSLGALFITAANATRGLSLTVNAGDFVVSDSGDESS